MRQIVDKIGAILALYSFERGEWGVGELALELDMAKSSVSELMTSLAGQGFVERTRRGRYRLGWRFFTLNQVLLASTPLVKAARPVMQEMVERHGETSHLMVLERDQAVIVEKVSGTLATQILLSRIGVRLPAYCSGAGKVMLAALEAQTIAELFGKAELEAMTPKTIGNLAALRAELERITSRGYAVDREEIVPGLSCAAAPIRDVSGRVVAGLSMSTPSYRFDETEVAPVVVKAAQRISHQLGAR